MEQEIQNSNTKVGCWFVTPGVHWQSLDRALCQSQLCDSWSPLGGQLSKLSRVRYAAPTPHMGWEATRAANEHSRSVHIAW